MYATFNMGIGFCVVVGKSEQQAALDALKGAGEDAVRIGWVTSRPGKTVSIPAAGLLGKGDPLNRYVRFYGRPGLCRVQRCRGVRRDAR